MARGGHTTTVVRFDTTAVRHFAARRGTESAV